MKFKNHYNYDFTVVENGMYEKNTLPSETRPDETLTVIEIWKRYAQGKPLSVMQKNMVYEGTDPSLPLDWDRMDISERYAFAERHKIRLTEAKAVLEKTKEEKEHKELEDVLRTKILLEMEAEKSEVKPEKSKPEKPKPNP